MNPDRLIGANRRYVESRLPHLREMLAPTPGAALEDASVAVVGTADPQTIGALVEARPKHVLDVHGRLGEDVEAMAGYEGLAW